MGIFLVLPSLVAESRFLASSGDFLLQVRSDALCLGTLLAHSLPAPCAIGESRCRRCPVLWPPGQWACRWFAPVARLPVRFLNLGHADPFPDLLEYISASLTLPNRGEAHQYGLRLLAFCHWLEHEDIIERPISARFKLPKVEEKFIPTFTPMTFKRCLKPVMRVGVSVQRSTGR